MAFGGLLIGPTELTSNKVSNISNYLKTSQKGSTNFWLLLLKQSAPKQSRVLKDLGFDMFIHDVHLNERIFKNFTKYHSNGGSPCFGSGRAPPISKMNIGVNSNSLW